MTDWLQYHFIDVQRSSKNEVLIQRQGDASDLNFYDQKKNFDD